MKSTILALIALLALSTVGPACAAPVRVGIFKGDGNSTTAHTNIHTASAAIAAILANPQAADLGPSLVVAQQGVTSAVFGRDNGQGVPDSAQLAAFGRALDTLDVVVFLNNTRIGNVIPDSGLRARVAQFAQVRGVVSVHATLYSAGLWNAWDSLHGTQFNNHPLEQSGTVRQDSAAASDPAWRFLNRGLSDTVNFVEEWLFFTNSGADIRARTGLKVALNLKESSLQTSGGLPPMGDHPMAWYRGLPQGGRFFYTALGHRAQNYILTSSSTPPAGPRFVRRHLYNAILWAAGVDTNGVVGVMKERPAFPRGFEARVTGEGMWIGFADRQPRTVEVHGVDGRRVMRAVVRGEATLLLPRGAYVLSAGVSQGSIAHRRVVVP